MKNIDILREVESELKRFAKKLKEAIVEQQEADEYGGSHKKYASVKRAALDLKNELTKLTQDSKYKYSK